MLFFMNGTQNVIYLELTSALANQAKVTSGHIEKNIFEENVNLNDCEFYLYG